MSRSLPGTTMTRASASSRVTSSRTVGVFSESVYVSPFEHRRRTLQNTCMIAGRPCLWMRTVPRLIGGTSRMGTYAYETMGPMDGRTHL